MQSVPSWVYILFLGLLYLSIKGCYKRIIKPQRLIVIPLVFAWFSIENVYRVGPPIPSQLIFLICGGILGIYLGYLHVRKVVVRADKQQHLAAIPGDWTILILIMVIFLIQFSIHYLLAIDPSLTNKTSTVAFILGVSGLTTGLVIGRNLTYFYKYTKAPHEHLAAKK